MTLPNITTNFKFSNGVDVGEVLITKDYFLSVYPHLMPNFLFSNLWSAGYTPPISGNRTYFDVFSYETNWKQIGAGRIWPGYNHVAAIKTDGSLWTAGSNSYGELGLGDNTFRSSLTRVGTENNWRYVTCGSNTTAAIKNDGTLWTTGRNVERQLGLGDATNRRYFTQVGLSNVKKVSAGVNSMTAIGSNSIFTWGTNRDGVLGISDIYSSTTKSYPTATYSSGLYRDVSMNDNTVFVINDRGDMYSWGNLSSYGLGSFNSFQGYVGGGPWKSVSCGIDHVAAIKTDGTLWVMGGNALGQLGNGTRTSSSYFIQVPGIWKEVSCGNFFTAALRTDGSIWTCGNNQDGQLGRSSSSSYITTFGQITAGGYNWRSISSSTFGVYGIRSYEF